MPGAQGTCRGGADAATARLAGVALPARLGQRGVGKARQLVIGQAEGLQRRLDGIEFLPGIDPRADSIMELPMPTLMPAMVAMMTSTMESSSRVKPARGAGVLGPDFMTAGAGAAG
jgi:hypothetical protein